MSFGMYVPGPTPTPKQSQVLIQEIPSPLAASPTDPLPLDMKRGPPSNGQSRRRFPRRALEAPAGWRGGGSQRGDRGPARSEARSPPSNSIAITSVGLAPSMRVDGISMSIALALSNMKGGGNAPEKKLRARPDTTPPRSQFCPISLAHCQNRDSSKVGIASWSSIKWRLGPGWLHSGLNRCDIMAQASSSNLDDRPREGEKRMESPRGSCELLSRALSRGHCLAAVASVLGKWPGRLKPSLGAIKAQLPSFFSTAAQPSCFLQATAFSGLFPWHRAMRASTFWRPFQRR